MSSQSALNASQRSIKGLLTHHGKVHGVNSKKRRQEEARLTLQAAGKRTQKEASDLAKLREESSELASSLSSLLHSRVVSRAQRGAAHGD